jgi:hypothetical protein
VGVVVVVVGVLFVRADPEHGHDKGAGKAAGQTRAKIWRGLSDVVRDAEFGIAPGGGFQTKFSSRVVSEEWRG